MGRSFAYTTWPLVLCSHCGEMYFFPFLLLPLSLALTFHCRLRIQARLMLKFNFWFLSMSPGWKMVVRRHHFGPWPSQLCWQSIHKQISIKLWHSLLQMKLVLEGPVLRTGYWTRPNRKLNQSCRTNGPVQWLIKMVRSSVLTVD